jgi:hypothetical protein
MAALRFADMRFRPTEFLDFTSLNPGRVPDPDPRFRGSVSGAYDLLAP